MLTRDLLRYRIATGNAKPSFIETRDPSLLNFASQLIAVYTDGCGSKRMDVEAAAAQIVNAKRDLKLARGLQKILEDRCEYSSCSDYDYPALRQALFARSAELFKNSELPEDISVYHDKVMEREETLSSGIYADLPENEQLTGIKKIFPSELLERYNTSLVQSLLLFSSELEAEIAEEEPAELRRLFKYLKFFRLLCTAEAVADKKNKKQPQVIRLKIDGPASILENSLKYGLQLASFFPALCRLKKWKISSAIKVRERNLKLKLDETSGLKCHYTNFGAYIPEEIKMFQSCFNLVVTSNSGQAALTMPIMAPLADIIGISRQVAVLAFQLGAGFVDAFTPVSASLIGVLGVARIDWGKWAKFQIKMQAFFFLLGTAAIAIAIAINLQ